MINFCLPNAGLRILILRSIARQYEQLSTKCIPDRSVAFANGASAVTIIALNRSSRSIQENIELFTFKAFAFGGELDLNRLAVKLGISRKYRWEEPMKLNSVTFAHATANDTEQVYLYYFGGVVFLNCSGDIGGAGAD